MRWAIIGLGNPLRQDDGIGRLLAQALHQTHSGWPVWEASGEATELLSLLSSLDGVVLLDATMGSGPPGTIVRHDASHQPVGLRRRQSSSHGMGLAEALELARALDQLPPRVILFTVEAQAFDHGESLSAAVQNAFQDAILQIEHEVADWLEPQHVPTDTAAATARDGRPTGSSSPQEGSHHA